MVKDWDAQGCQMCRDLWMRGKTPRELRVDHQTRVTWHRCDVCRAFWVETERYATEVPREAAVERFGKGILDE